MRTPDLIVRIAALALCIVLPACGGSPGANLRIDSTTRAITMAPEAITAIYGDADENTADVYLSDIPLATLTGPADDLAIATGTIVHIHLFLYPEAGRIPIDPAACNATVRQIVLAAGHRGVYGGGGFILPAGPPGTDLFSASVREMTLVLLGSGPGFADRLGTAKLTGSFTAARDDVSTRTIRARLATLTAAIPDVPAPAAPAPAPIPTHPRRR